MIIGILSIIFWLGLIPLCVGSLMLAGFSQKNNNVIKMYVFGLIVYLSVFQVLIVSNMLTVNDFFMVCTHFQIAMVILAVLGVSFFVVRSIKERKGKVVVEQVRLVTESKQKKIENLVLWFLFLGVLVFQLIQVLRLTYPDGDDAYYVGTATYGVYVPEMYSKIPYTGATTTFDTRHCLAPLPYVISFLARMSGISAVTIAHSILPFCFLLVTYGIYYLIAKELCGEKREVSLFMLLVSVLFMFGNYSVYSMETFLMTRTRQGKASLGSLALPVAFYLLLLIAKELEGKRRDRVIYYVLLGCNAFVAALFTTMGNFIYPCMIMLGSVCICFSKKQWKKLFPLMLTCIPSGIMAMLYILIR